MPRIRRADAAAYMRDYRRRKKQGLPLQSQDPKVDKTHAACSTLEAGLRAQIAQLEREVNLMERILASEGIYRPYDDLDDGGGGMGSDLYTTHPASSHGEGVPPRGVVDLTPAERAELGDGPDAEDSLDDLL